MALRVMMSRKVPMVIIVGATGTGKTKLAIELAQKYDTEIISADSMQIYKGLDVVTAKATQQERQMAPHHLLDILEPHQMFTVVDFRNRALNIINRLMEQGKIPIIVGGTNYYIESIVYNILVQDIDEDDNELLWDNTRRKRGFDDTELSEDNEPEGKATSSRCNENTKSDSKLSSTEGIDKDTEIEKEEIKNYIINETDFTNEEIHAKLKAIDPAMASRLHVNNRRKVIRYKRYRTRVGASLLTRTSDVTSAVIHAHTFRHSFISSPRSLTANNNQL